MRLTPARWGAGFAYVRGEGLAEAGFDRRLLLLRDGLTQDLFATGEDGVGIARALRWSSPTTALRYGEDWQFAATSRPECFHGFAADGEGLPISDNFPRSSCI